MFTLPLLYGYPNKKGKIIPRFSGVVTLKNNSGIIALNRVKRRTGYVLLNRLHAVVPTTAPLGR